MALFTRTRNKSSGNSLLVSSWVLAVMASANLDSKGASGTTKEVRQNHFATLIVGGGKPCSFTQFSRATTSPEASQGSAPSYIACGHSHVRNPFWTSSGNCLKAA